jgi:hypothetical protein
MVAFHTCLEEGPIMILRNLGWLFAAGLVCCLVVVLITAPTDRAHAQPGNQADPEAIDLNGNYAGYVNKRVVFGCGPQSVHVDKGGDYRAWQNITSNLHKFVFKADQVDALSEIKSNRFIKVSGIYVGKTGPTQAHTFKDCELIGKAGKSYYKPVLNTDKPLRLEDLIARLLVHEAEKKKAAKSGNANVLAQVVLAQEEEQKSWVRSMVKGTAEVVKLEGVYLRLYMKKDATHIIFIDAAAEDVDDPLLGNLKNGQVVEFQGVLQQQPTIQSTAFIVNDCTFTLKK